MFAALKSHWPEYLMEAFGLGVFMVSAGVFTILLYHPGSPALRAIPAEFVRRCLMGLAMGLTAVAIIYSPWGRQSGAHLNPAVTLTFWHLGKVANWDAAFYVAAQFLGGFAGVALVAGIASPWLADPAVNYAVTVPGRSGAMVAFFAEAGISFLLLLVVLTVSNHVRWASYTGMCAGLCVALFITFESPYSGMSMNPARTLGSAVLPHVWTSLWLYFVAPPLGMLLAAALYQAAGRTPACAKLHHQNPKRCIFCEHQTRPTARITAGGSAANH
jgi:aquaporin Z